MILPCAKCGADVPEGAGSCPKCGAGLASVVLSKERRGLTRTLIGKAVELRNSIPWASPSAIVLLDDPRRPGKKKVRPVARNVIIAVLGTAVVAQTVYLVTRPSQVFEVVVAPPETKPLGDKPSSKVGAGKPAADRPAADKPAADKSAADKSVADKSVADKLVADKLVATDPAPGADRPTVSDKPAGARPPTDEKPAIAGKAASAPPPAPAPAPPPAKGAAKAAAPAPAARPSGTLVVNTRFGGKPVTGAVVRINGVNLGPTPVNTSVLPGVYTVKVEKPGFKTEKRTDVEVRSAKKLVLTVDLKK